MTIKNTNNKINKLINIINLEEEEKLILEKQFNKISHKHHRQNLTKKKIKTDIEKSKCTFYKTEEDKKRN